MPNTNSLRAISVSVLFTAPKNSPYQLLGVDTWGQDRDARLYTGSNPVVVHPPCQRWGPLGAANYARYGGEHNRPGNDGGCFAFALDAVRRLDGVLEHPALSTAWPFFALQRPLFSGGWVPVPPKMSGGPVTEWVCRIWQSAYGHRAAKKTNLLYVSRAGHPPLECNWSQQAGTHQVGFANRKKHRVVAKPTLTRGEVTLTPLILADFLVRLASHARTGS